MISKSSELFIEQTLRDLDVDSTTQTISLSDTITPKILRELQGTTLAPHDSTAAITAGTLPRIHLSGSNERRMFGSEASAGEEHYPDLEILGKLGEGGLAFVHLANQHSLKRQVAIKRPRPEAPANSLSGLCDEAVVTGTLEHPNIIPVHALGLDGEGRPLIIMKRVVGRAWIDIIQQDTALPGWPSSEPELLSNHLQILHQVCNAVIFAHSREILHLDIKPANVMIGDFGEVYLVDWGLAARSHQPRKSDMLLVGTPVYLAPEMVTGDLLTPATDLYLLGATLHQVLTGTVRHPGTTLQQVLLHAVESKPTDYSPEIPEELATLANRATALDPQDRPESAAALQQALKCYEQHCGSVNLCRVAKARLAQLQRLMVSPGEGQRQDLQEEQNNEIHKALNESHFGFIQALSTWPDNPAAKRGLQACLEATVRFELTHRDLCGAQAALSQLAQPPPEITAEVDLLEYELAHEEREHAQLRTIAADIDPNVFIRLRGLVMWLYGGLSTILLLFLFIFWDESKITAIEAAVAAGATLMMLIGAGFTFRRKLLANAFNRRLYGWFILNFAAVLGNRLLGAWYEFQFPQVVALDFLIIIVLASSGGVLLHRALWVLAGTMILGLGAAQLWPQRSLFLLVLSAILCSLLAGYFLVRLAPDHRREDSP